MSYTGTVNKEEMYVEYLEKLLLDIELHRYSKQGGDVCGVPGETATQVQCGQLRWGS